MTDRVAFAYIKGQVPDAIPNGTRVRKVNSEDGDGNPNGTRGTVLSSISYPNVANGAPAYFVVWDTSPGMPVLCGGFKVAPEVSQ